MKSRVHLVNISFQRTEQYDATKQNLCVMKLSGKEHVHTFVGHIDPVRGNENLQEVLALMDRRYKVSFYPGIIMC